MLSPGERPLPDDEDPACARALLERILVQLHLVEVLYLRLIGLQTRRLAQPELEAQLLNEARKIEGELHTAQAELERLGCRLDSGNLARSALPGF